MLKWKIHGSRVTYQLESWLHYVLTCGLGPHARPRASVFPSAKWVRFYFPGLVCGLETVCMKYLALCMVQSGSPVSDSFVFLRVILVKTYSDGYLHWPYHGQVTVPGAVRTALLVLVGGVV